MLGKDLNPHKAHTVTLPRVCLVNCVQSLNEAALPKLLLDCSSLSLQACEVPYLFLNASHKPHCVIALIHITGFKELVLVDKIHGAGNNTKTFSQPQHPN